MTVLLLLASLGSAGPATGVTDPPALRESLKDFDVDARWIYDDLDHGRREARRTGRPLLVTFRCVPCDACRTIDFKVRQGDAALGRLLDRFTCVRIVHMKGVDLDRFQFDFDLSWAAVMMHHDGTVYGRYGSRAAGDSEALNTQAGFAASLRAALELHAGYPANRDALAGKQPVPGRFGVRFAEEFPGLRDRAAGPVIPKTCIHCHMIHDAVHTQAYRAKSFDRADLWKYPGPERLGLRLDPQDETRIVGVLAGSPAARAGMAAGDRLLSVGPGPVLSRADVQWALHTIPREATLAVAFRRDATTITGTLSLTGDWREEDFSWRASMYSLRPREHFWAPELTPEERRPLGLGERDLGLKVRWIPGDSTARAAGLQEGDLIVGVDDLAGPLTPGRLSMYVRVAKQPGDTLRLLVIRNGTRLELTQRLE